MTTPRTLVATFCDDVRQEVGNKVSYMGIYGGALYLPQFPSTLPKFCLVMVAKTPLERPFQMLTFKALIDDELLYEVAIPPQAIVEAIKQARDNPDLDPMDETIIAFGTVAQFAPFKVERPCKIRARAVTETEELKGGSVLVGLHPAAVPLAPST